MTTTRDSRKKTATTRCTVSPMYRAKRATLATDFDSVEEYDDDERSSNDISDYGNNNSGSSSDVSTSRDMESCRLHEFGKFEDNHGWIQCRSKSFPNRIYYYNTRSGCNTWYRPVSRYVDVPSTASKRANCMGDPLESASHLELMSVSDDEKERKRIPADNDQSLIDTSDIIAQYYYTVHMMDLIPSMDDSTDVRFKMPLIKQEEKEEEESEHFGMPLIKQNEEEEKEEADMSYNDENNNVDDMKSSDCSSLCAANFVNTELLLEGDAVDTKPINRLASSCLSKETVRDARRVVYNVPRLKRISFENQLVKPRRTCVPKSQKTPGPKKIIYDMYGVRTVNYDPPNLGDICATMGVKMSTLSGSDSDNDNDLANASSSLSRRAETTFKSKWRDIEKDIRQPLLSDSSSSSSSRSSTSPSSSSSSTTSSSSESSSGSSSCSCSSCSRKGA
ncbi:uncharacterized protein DDB_G0284459 [Monomorium pharaonis]|uniref:uncharacterized protein DDB_G0284459 n=1 Tax=Monomorium pharaonis TaxID=307658 RepID=UPI001747B196|nr:uncharacterized protein DDB_G0284459 [Monomorium pharaonis]